MSADHINYSRLVAVVASVLGACAVGLAAYGAHGSISNPLAWQQAWLMQLFHVLALLVLVGNSRWLIVAKCCWLLGIVLFSGSIYGIGLLWWSSSAFTPFGGMALITGWLIAAIHYGLGYSQDKQC